MPGKVQADLVREHGEILASLSGRVEHLQQGLDRFERDMQDRVLAEFGATKRLVHDLDKQFDGCTGKVENLEKRLDDLLTRRWDLSKLVIAALFGSIIPTIGMVATLWQAGTRGPISNQYVPATPAPVRK